MEEGSAATSLAEVQLHYLTMSLGEYPGLRRTGCVILRGNWKYLVEFLTFDVAKKKLVIQVSCQMRAGCQLALEAGNHLWPAFCI